MCFTHQAQSCKAGGAPICHTESCFQCPRDASDLTGKRPRGSRWLGTHPSPSQARPGGHALHPTGPYRGKGRSQEGSHRAVLFSGSNADTAEGTTQVASPAEGEWRLGLGASMEEPSPWSCLCYITQINTAGSRSGSGERQRASPPAARAAMAPFKRGR